MQVSRLIIYVPEVPCRGVRLAGAWGVAGGEDVAGAVAGSVAGGGCVLGAGKERTLFDGRKGTGEECIDCLL